MAAPVHLVLVGSHRALVLAVFGKLDLDLDRELLHRRAVRLVLLHHFRLVAQDLPATVTYQLHPASNGYVFVLLHHFRLVAQDL
jgi:hypothetical protein